MHNLRTAIVFKATGSWYLVKLLPDGPTAECRARGRIRLNGARSTNPIVVGDIVRLSGSPSTDGTQEFVIEEILPRKNYIIRKASNLSKESHIIAANLDLAIIVVTLLAPATPLEFIDRFLATAKAYDIPAIIARAKCDIEEENKAADDIQFDTIYRSAGYPIICTSSNAGQGIDELSQLLSHKTSLFAGMSGAGKSSLLNAIHPPLALRTAPISNYSQRGTHTTTFCEAYEIPDSNGTILIDSPGIKGFGIIDFKPEETSHFFPEIFAAAANCRFPSCLHLHEPGCAVLRALEEKKIAPSRYNSYKSILLDEGKKYR